MTNMARPFFLFGVIFMFLGLFVGGKDLPKSPAEAYVGIWVIVTLAALFVAGIEWLISWVANDPSARTDITP